MGELHKRSKHSSSSVDPPEHEHLLNVNLSDAPYDEPASSHSSMDLCSNKPSYKPSHKPLVTKKISDMNKKKKTSSSNCFSRRGILCATMFLLMATALVMFPDSSSSFGDFMLPTSVDMDLRKEMGYVVSIHGSNTHELCGALMLAWTLRDRDPGHDLLAVISGELSSQEEYSFTREVLQKVGYNITEGKDLLNPQSNDPIDKYIYSHLNVFGVENYKKLVWIDVDYLMVGGAPSEIVANHSGYPKPAAFSHSNPIDSSIKGGFVIFQPSSALFQDMQDIFHKFADKGDEHIQGFIDKYFQNRTGGFEYIDDTGVFMDNFNKNGPVPRDRLKGIHFFGSEPWMCPRGLHCACFKVGRQRAIWPEANNLWWEYYDKMVAAWPWLIEDKRYKSLCITNNADCNWSPGAKLHVNRFKPKAASLAFLHIPRNGGGSIEYAASKKHIRWGICNYWQKDGVCSKDNPPVYTKVTNPFMYQWYHVPIQWIPEEVPTYYKGHDLFAVVRNPYDRMVSEFNWQCHSMRYCEENEESIIGNATFLNEWLDAQLTKFRECPKVEKLDPAHPDQPCVMMWSGHFIRQSDFIFDGPTMDKPMVDYVLHFETLAEEFVSLMKDYSMNLTLTPYNLHRTDKGLTVQDLNKTTIDLINEVYLRDFKLWGYIMM